MTHGPGTMTEQTTDWDKPLHSQPETKVGLAESHVTNDSKACLVASMISSGVVVAIYDPEVKVGGMLHYLLPDKDINFAKAMENPSLFANSGIPNLYRQCYRLGAKKERIICCLVGGADLINPSGMFTPGEDNHEGAVDVLGRNGVSPWKEWIGGWERRCVRLFLSDGRVVVESG